MTDQHTTQKRSFGISFIGWLVIFSNAFLLAVYYLEGFPFLQKVIPLFGILGVFPYETFDHYFSSAHVAQGIWILLILFCGFGILLLNKMARAVFIILNIVQVVLIFYLMLLRANSPELLDYVFKTYFHIMVCGSYVLYLTIPDIRQEFHIDLEGLRLQIWLQRPLNKTLSQQDGKRYADLAVAYSRLGRHEQAVDAIEKAISVEKEHAPYYFQLGLLFLKLQQEAEAAQAFKQAIVYEPLHFDAYFNLGILYMKQGSAQEAVECFLKSVHAQPKSDQAYRELGDARASLGQFEAAVEAFEQAIRLSQRDGYSYYRCGEILATFLDDFHKAYPLLRTATHLMKDSFDGFYVFGKVCYHLEKHKEAVRALHDALHLKDDAQARYYLGMAYVKLKDNDSAHKQYCALKESNSELACDLELLIKSL